MKENRESPAGNSQLKLYQACPRKWAWKYLKGFKPGSKSEPLNLGSALHEAQEVFYTTGDIDKAQIRGTEILNNAGWDPVEERFIYQRLLVGLREWISVLGQDDYDNGTVKEVEKEYKLTLPNGYVMTVRVDSLMDDSEEGLYIRDTKSTKSGPAQTIQQYMFDPQPVLYVATLRQNGIDVAGWKTDAVAMAVLKSGPRAQVIRSNMVCPAEDRIRDVLDSYAYLTDCIKMSLDAIDKDVPMRYAFPMNPQACYSYFRPCPYFSICHSIDEIEEPTLGFSLDPWLKEGTVLSTFDKITEEL